MIGDMNMLRHHTYDEIIEIHRAKSMRYIAGSFHVGDDHVHFVGIIDRPPLYQICTQHRPDPFQEYDLPIVKMPPTIVLDKEFEHVDNVLNRKTSLFAGQCQECGHVYVAEARFGRY